MNKGKLEVLKQKMAGVNIDILGIRELKWTGMGEFNSGDHYIYYCRQESFRRNGVALRVNKRIQNAVLRCNLKNNRMISLSLPKISNSLILKISKGRSSLSQKITSSFGRQLFST